MFDMIPTVYSILAKNILPVDLLAWHRPAMNHHPNLNQVSPYDEDDHLSLYNLYTGQSPVKINKNIGSIKKKEKKKAKYILKKVT